MSDDVVLEFLSCDGECWHAEVSFRDQRYSMGFMCDYAGRLRPMRSPLALTTEGEEICSLVDRVRKGAVIHLPLRVVPTRTFSHYLAARDLDWRPPLRDVWVESVRATGESRWLAHLHFDGEAGLYELQFFPGPVMQTLRSPEEWRLSSYEFDLTRLLLRMQNGERFSFPLELRTRWPTPPDFTALP